MFERIVSIEAASLDEVKSPSAGMRIGWGVAESPFGLCSLGWSGRRICHLAFYDQALAGMPDNLRVAWPSADFSRNDRAAKERTRDIFARKSAEHILVFVRGTAFQLNVWRELLRIPRGSVATYSNIAAAIGIPGAYRAVGTACRSNPVAWLIPCHRVILATGAISGYRWGTERKRSMLAAEAWAASRPELSVCE